MNDNNISITFSTNNYNTLTRIEDFVHGLVIDASKNNPLPTKEDLQEHLGKTEEGKTTGVVDNTATEKFAKTTGVMPKGALEETNPAPPPPATATTAAPPPNVDVDNAGLPWDARIHSGGKTKVKKTQLWTKRRNVDPAVVEQVETELKVVMTIPAPPPQESNGLSYADILAKVTATLNDNTITMEQVNNAISKHGLTNITNLEARPDLIPVIDNELFG